VTVKTEKPVIDLSEQLRQLLPEAVLLQVREECESRQLQVDEEELGPAQPEQTFEDMFREYLATHPTKNASADGVFAVFSTLVRAVEEEETPSFPEEGLLLSDQMEEGERSSVVDSVAARNSTVEPSTPTKEPKRPRKRKTAEAE